MSALHQHTAERSSQDLEDSSYTYTNKVKLAATLLTQLNDDDVKHHWRHSMEGAKQNITINLPITHFLYYCRQGLLLLNDTAKKQQHAVRHLDTNMLTKHKNHTPVARMCVTITGQQTIKVFSLSGTSAHASVITCCYGITVPQIFLLAASLVCREEEILELPNTF